MSKHYVYVLYWPGRPECYVGCSYHPRRRLGKHRDHVAEGRGSTMYTFWREHGRPQLLVLEVTPTLEEGVAAEERWIRLLLGVGEVLLNDTYGGETNELRPDTRLRLADRFTDPKYRQRRGWRPEKGRHYSCKLGSDEWLGIVSAAGKASMNDPGIRARSIRATRSSVALAMHHAVQQRLPHTTLVPKRW